MTRDEKIARATSITVGFVAFFAALVSYLHIRDLALLNGYDWLTAYLAPFGVDGLIVGASLMLLTAHRNKLSAPVARLALWLGIGGTLAANVAYGLPHGVVGATVSAWPAASFIMIVEAWLQLQKRKRKAKKSQTATDKKTRTTTQRRETLDISKDFEANNLPAPNGSGPIKAYAIRKKTGCNQAKAAELAAIMNEDSVDLVTAMRIRDDRKKGARDGARA